MNTALFWDDQRVFCRKGLNRIYGKPEFLPDSVYYDPQNSASGGMPSHIMEHSVLCGSEKYPLKDPFNELEKGSLNTYLNALTYSDKTMYPVASVNDKDFDNLVRVYADAVFKPNVLKEEKILKQEGWHYEL